jgi:hypothetical protein
MIFRLICIYTLLTISPLKNLYTRLLELSFVSDFLRVTRCVFDKKQELLSFGEYLASSHFVLFVLVLCLIPNVACISKPEADWPYIWAMSGAHIDNILMNNGRSDRSQMLRPTGFKTQSASVMDCQFLIVHSLVLPCELRKNIFIYLY